MREEVPDVYGNPCRRLANGRKQAGDGGSLTQERAVWNSGRRRQVGAKEEEAQEKQDQCHSLGIALLWLA